MLTVFQVSIRKGLKVPAVLRFTDKLVMHETLSELQDRGFSVLEIKDDIAICQTNYEAISIAERIDSMPEAV